MAILVCGGAGYIGSHTALELVRQDLEVVVLDNLSTGFRESVPEKAKFYCGDLLDTQTLDRVFGENKIDAVIHFAASSLVGESVLSPLKYYKNNVCATQNLLSAMTAHDILNIVFSSTAATYGEPVRTPILETDPTIPKNPYGETKLAIEKMLKWCGNAHGLKYIILRYFNVAGADISQNIGEKHDPETHLIPLVLRSAINDTVVKVFGTDFQTYDGTCVRDYIHVTDLSFAHIAAYKKLISGGDSGIYNLGNGNGFSVLEIIEAAEDVVGKKIKIQKTGRRAGDPATLIASSKKAADELGFLPKYADIHSIIKTAYDFYLKEYTKGN